MENKTKNSSASEKPKADQKPELKSQEVLTPEKDVSVQNAGPIASSVDGGNQATKESIDAKAESKSEAKDNKEILKEDEKLKEDIQNGDTTIVTTNPASDLSELAKPMVHNPIGGKPVYESSKQARLAEAAQGKLSTPEE